MQPNPRNAYAALDASDGCPKESLKILTQKGMGLITQ